MRKSASEHGEAVEVWLLRHGQTEANRAGCFSGWTDVALTELGRRQAAVLRPVLRAFRFSGVHSSDLQRAVETARIAYGEPRPDRRFRELHFGALEGARWADLSPELQARLERFRSFAPPDGESLETFRARVFEALDALPPGRHLVVTHGGVLRLLTRGQLDRFLVNTAVVSLTWPGGRIRFVFEPRVPPPGG